MQLIPTNPIPWQEFFVVLDDQKCTITLRQVAERLFCDLAVDGVWVFAGRLVCTGSNINLYPSPNFRGRLFVVDTLGKEDPQYEGLNDRWLLVYETAEEVSA